MLLMILVYVLQIEVRNVGYKRVGVVQLNAPNAAYKTKNKSQNQRTVGRTVLKLS